MQKGKSSGTPIPAKTLAPSMLGLDRAGMVDLAAPQVRDMILANNTIEEAVVKVDIAMRLLKSIDGDLRAQIADTMDGSYALDIFGRYQIIRAKAPARWEYITNKRRAALLAQLAVLSGELKDLEHEMQTGGGAVDQNENKYIIKINERKLTK